MWQDTPPQHTPNKQHTQQHTATHSNTQYTHNAQQRCNANITYSAHTTTPHVRHRRVLGVLTTGLERGVLVDDDRLVDELVPPADVHRDRDRQDAATQAVTTELGSQG